MSYRDKKFEHVKVPAMAMAAVVAAALLIAAIFMLIADRREDLDAKAYGARGAFDQAAATLSSVAATPVRATGDGVNWLSDYINAVEENRRLKTEVAEVEHLRAQIAVLQNVNRRYETLLNIRTEPPVQMVAARAVADVRGPLSNTRLIDVGSNKGVVIGNPVINENGLIGRITGVGPSVSRIMLLTDSQSRTPVMIHRTDARSIMVGDGGDNPKLEFVRGVDAVKEGDVVFSSGDGGVMPRGLPVGVAAQGLDQVWRVKLFADHGPLDYVRVLLFKDFRQISDVQALDQHPPLAALKVAPAPESNAARAVDAAASAAAAGGRRP